MLIEMITEEIQFSVQERLLTLRLGSGETFKPEGGLKT